MRVIKQSWAYWLFVLMCCMSHAKTTQKIEIENTQSNTGRYSAYTDTVSCDGIMQAPDRVYAENCQSLDKDYQIVKHNYDVQTWLNIRHQSYYLNYQATLLPMTIGEKLEWRYIKKDNKSYYYALIYRIYVYEDYETDTLLKAPKNSFLMVVKLDKEKSCIVAKINANQNNANEKARLIADGLLNQQVVCWLKMQDENKEPEILK